MITAFGHHDLTPEALARLEASFHQDLALLPPGSTAVVRAAAGVPVAFGRAVRAAGHRLLVVVPGEAGLPGSLPAADRDAASELLRLATLTRLLPYAPERPDSCITADERILAGCRRATAVWDGSPSSRTDATAHLVAYGRGLGLEVEDVWPEGLRRGGAAGVCAGPTKEHPQRSADVVRVLSMKGLGDRRSTSTTGRDSRTRRNEA